MISLIRIKATRCTNRSRDGGCLHGQDKEDALNLINDPADAVSQGDRARGYARPSKRESQRSSITLHPGEADLAQDNITRRRVIQLLRAE